MGVDAPETTATKTAKVLAAFGKVGGKKARGGGGEEERSGESKRDEDREMEMAMGGPDIPATPAVNVLATFWKIGGQDVVRGGVGVEEPSAGAGVEAKGHIATSDDKKGNAAREHDAEGALAPAAVTEPPASLAAPVVPSHEPVDAPLSIVEGSVSAMDFVDEPCPLQTNEAVLFSQDTPADPPSGQNHELETPPSTQPEITKPPSSVTSSNATLARVSQQLSSLQPELTQPPPSFMPSASTLGHASQPPTPPTHTTDATQLTTTPHADPPASHPRESAESAKSAESDVFVDAEEGRSSAGTHVQEIQEHHSTPTRESPGKENVRPGVVLPPKSPFLPKGDFTLADRLKAAGMPKFNFVQPSPPPVPAGGKRDRASLKEPDTASDGQGQVKRQKVDVLGLSVSQPKNSLSGGAVRVQAAIVANAGPQAPKPGVGLTSSSWKTNNTKPPRAPAPARSPVVQAQKGSWAAAWQPVPVSLNAPISYAHAQGQALRNPNPVPPVPPPRAGTEHPKPTPHPAPAARQPLPPATAAGAMKNPPKLVVRGLAAAAAPPAEPTRAIYEPSPPPPRPAGAVLATPPSTVGVEKGGNGKGGPKTEGAPMPPPPPQSIVDANGGEIPDIPSDDESEDSPRASGRTPQWARDKSVHEALIRQSQSQVPVEDIFGEVDPNVDLEAIFGRPIRKLKGRRSSVRWLKDDMSP
ncbi:hypothetical protein M427DRAFT_133652 [Gonapodya prolifera JEL478]|uniref:Inner centromere protein ARK-binding domain-containing protein n=1 Tax=Gonapodya prolifera (strain JEL478) TaxID=1344416 RepID=A0A139AKK0_GONPJ|nr:hypothetical protein M427DRAFT_133652 [Gonapodya prolifera JEL478]|eukprot:KXS17218.1 hypothetical protein M427DRAFT_133652 [Gonapodya prolifera JEL478]